MAINDLRSAVIWGSFWTPFMHPHPATGSSHRAALLLIAMAASPAHAMQVTGYSSTLHDRFSSGFPAAPVANSSPLFVGLPYALSPVGWSASDGTKGFGFLTPQHYLVAVHYGGATSLRLLGSDGVVSSHTQASVSNTGYGTPVGDPTTPDLAVGRLAAPAARIARHGILDLNPSSAINSSAPYAGIPVLVYGRGPNGTTSPRVAATTLGTVTQTGPYVTTPRTDAQLEIGDSGSPLFARWTNPDGSPELAFLGNHSAVDATLNYHSFLGTDDVMAALNALTSPDGFSVRIVGNPSNTWVGASSTNLGNRGAWGLSAPATAPSDVFVLFNAATATGRSVNVDAARSLRGLYFRSTANAGDAFTFGGSAVLTIGRGGLTNYDADRQTFNAPLALGAPQVWLAGPGGLTATNIDTNGHLLEILGGTAEVVLSGTVSDTGSLALNGGTLRLPGNSTFTGTSWVHEGTLRVDGSLAATSNVRIGANGILSGSGSVGPLLGSGRISPGPGAAILRAVSLDPSSGADLDLSFSAFAPTFSAATASANDLLRLTSASPLTASATAANTLRIFLNLPLLGNGDTLAGGVFSDAGADLAALLTGATLQIHVPDPSGTLLHDGTAYRLYTGPLAFTRGSAAVTAAFASGSVSGTVLTLTATAVPGAPVATYSEWASTQFNAAALANTAQSGTGADPDSDGWTNLQEYAFGGSAITADGPALGPQVFLAGDRLRMTYTRRATATDLTYSARSTADLSAAFTDASVSVISTSAPDSAGLQTVEVEEVNPLSPSAPLRFLRLELSTP